MILYRYALDKDDKIISIDTVLSSKRDEKYICPECGGYLSPRALYSEKVTPHFYHPTVSKAELEKQCNSESYIHWISKELLAEALSLKTPFKIKYDVNLRCKYFICLKQETKEIDIASFEYITTEKKDGEYVPDILLENASKEKIYIEIFKSSSISTKKRNSGHKIIEIKVNNSNDIENIIKKREIRERQVNIEFIGFREKPKMYDCNNKCKDKRKKQEREKVTNLGLQYKKRTYLSKMIGFYALMNKNYSYEDKKSVHSVELTVAE